VKGSICQEFGFIAISGEGYHSEQL